MTWKTPRHFSEEAFLCATFSEFIKCWGSGKRARIFVESMNGGAFVNFSTFLGNPGSDHINHRKMAATTSRHPEGHHEDIPRNPHSGSAPTSSRKKSKRKTERDNKRAAEFQKRKADEAERGVSAATANPSEEKEATATEGEVAKAAPDDDENTANTANEARVSVINVVDKTLGDNLLFMGNVPRFSFHDNSDTDSEALLNVDGNELLENSEDRSQDLCKESDQELNDRAENEAKTKAETHDSSAHRIPDPPPPPPPQEQQRKLFASTANKESFPKCRDRKEMIQLKVLNIFAPSMCDSKVLRWNLKYWKDFLAGLYPRILEINFWEEAEHRAQHNDQIEQKELKKRLLWQRANPKEFLAWLEKRNGPWDDWDTPSVSSRQTHQKKKKKRKSRF